MGRIAFFVAEAYRALRRNAAPSIAAIVTIAVTVVLLGVLVPALHASGSKTQEVREQITLKVFLFDEASRGEITELGARIEAMRHVTGVEFVSKRQALRDLERRLNQEDLTAALENRNPLPASFNVTPDSPDNLESIQAAIMPPDAAGKPQPISPAIEEVLTPEQAEPIRLVTAGITIYLITVAALLGAAALFLVGNTIRLSIYARRREIEVMRLVGATSWFVRWPFVIEGIVVGLAGAAIAVVILFVGKVVMAGPLSENFALIDNLNTIGFAPLVAILVASAMAVAALGSGVTLRRFLRV